MSWILNHRKNLHISFLLLSTQETIALICPILILILSIVILTTYPIFPWDYLVFFNVTRSGSFEIAFTWSTNATHASFLNLDSARFPLVTWSTIVWKSACSIIIVHVSFAIFASKPVNIWSVLGILIVKIDIVSTWLFTSFDIDDG